VIMVLDVDQAEVDLAAGVLACRRCAGRLRPWSWARARWIRLLDGAVVALSPRRARCVACRGTQLLLPAWCLPRRADAVAVVGAALVGKAAGRGHRRIAADLGRPASTVRRWLRAVRGRHGQWLYRQGVEHAARLAPEVLDEIATQPTELGDALTALAAAVLAVHRRFGRRLPSWTIVGILTGGRLLTPAPSG
jgi:transposase-like protein